jgi:hypothetical protein
MDNLNNNNPIVDFKKNGDHYIIDQTLIKNSNVDKTINELEKFMEKDLQNNIIYDINLNSPLENFINKDEIINYFYEILSNSKLEKFLSVSDPYLGMMIVTLLFLLLSIYLFIIIVVNYKYPNIFIIPASTSRFKFIREYFDFMSKLRGILLDGVIIMCFLCLLSCLFFLVFVIRYYIRIFY